MKIVGKYIINVLISIDQLVNTIFFGDPDETISSRIGKNPKLTFIHRFLFWGLNKIDKNHCINAIEKDEGKDKILD